MGPYEILSPLGAGGMGEVYRARDTRLDRSVAVKVKPAHIAKREDLRARFERDARAVASLSHPNIYTRYDIGAQDRVSYMVMSCSNARRLQCVLRKARFRSRRRLPLPRRSPMRSPRRSEHRDVKPGNRTLGWRNRLPRPGPNEATLTHALTTEGAVIGTPQYMALEQRTPGPDIWPSARFYMRWSPAPA